MITIKTEDVFHVGENVSNYITVKVSEGLKNADLRLEFETPLFEKYCTPEALIIDPETCEAMYSVPKSILSYHGLCHIQAVATLDSYIEKSDVLEVEVEWSVNAIESLPDEQPDLVRTLQGKVEDFFKRLTRIEENPVDSEDVADAVEDYMVKNPGIKTVNNISPDENGNIEVFSQVKIAELMTALQ